MQHLVESSGDVRSYPGKGHDLIYINDDEAVYAVVDGANDDLISRAVIKALPEAVAEHRPLRINSSKEFMANVLYDVDRAKPRPSLRRGSPKAAAAALVAVTKRKDEVEINLSAVGDVSVYLGHNVGGNDLRVPQLVAHTRSNVTYEAKGGTISTAGFLGSRRSLQVCRGLVRTLVLPAEASWMMVAATDGLYHESIVQAMREAPFSQIVNTAMNAYVRHDDAAAIAISRNMPHEAPTLPVQPRFDPTQTVLPRW